MQLALFLTDEALACLLLLSPDESGSLDTVSNLGSCAQQYRWGSWALLPPEADDIAKSPMVVGWSHAGDFCHVPITLAGAPCTARVDMGSTATLMRPDVVPVGTQLE